MLAYKQAGSEVLPAIKKLYGDKNEPIPAPGILLDRAGNEPEEVWTPQSLTRNRVVILGVWLVLYLLLSVVFSAFVLTQLPTVPRASAGSIWGLVIIMLLVVTVVVVATGIVLF
jgi:hypothetical protein